MLQSSHRGAGRPFRLRRWLEAGAAAVMALALSQAASAASVRSQNLVDLIQHADRILIGTIERVSDGFDDKNVPYTEVTLRVGESIRGKSDTSYTFRQFGLIRPREIDGRTYLGVSPEGWPRWNEKERVMLFLSRPAHLTGLQTTVGLLQGKLLMLNGRLTNAESNSGMFRGMKVSVADLTREQSAMLESDGQAVDANPFISLVRRAVAEQWVEKGVMRHEN